MGGMISGISLLVWLGIVFFTAWRYLSSAGKTGTAGSRDLVGGNLTGGWASWGIGKAGFEALGVGSKVGTNGC